MRIIVALIFLMASAAHAEIFKCTDPATGKTTFTDVACPNKSTGTYVPVKPTNLDTANTEAARVAQARANYERNTTSSDGRRYFGGAETEALRAAQMEQAVEGGDRNGVLAKQLSEEGLTPERRAAYKTSPPDEVKLRQQQDEPTISGHHDRREHPRHKQRDVAERHNESESTLCPDGTYVGGDNCRMAPDGSYVGGDSFRLNSNGSYTGGEESTLCPDGTYVSGNNCHLAPDGSYVGGSSSQLNPDGSYTGRD